MRLKAKLISAVGLFLMMIVVAGFFIADEIAGDKSSENGNIVSEVDDKDDYYMGPLSVSHAYESKAEQTTEEKETETTPEVTETEMIETETTAETAVETTLEELETEAVTEATTEIQAIESQETAAEEFDLYHNIFIVNDAMLNGYLNVRDVPGGSIIGILYPSFGGNVISYDGGWAYIVSGEVIGYVDSSYIITGNDAVEASDSNIYAIVTSDTLSLRKKPQLDGEIMDYLKKGGSYKVHSVEDGWVKVNNADMYGYVSADHVMLSLDVNKAIPTPTEFWEALTAPAESESTMAVPESVYEVVQPPVVETTAAPVVETAPVIVPVAPVVPETQPVPQTTVAVPETQPQAPAQDLSADEQIAQRIMAYAASGNANRGTTILSAADVYLMSCVLMIEDGYGTLEGQLAVANVLINRLQAGHWGNTMSGVVYAPNQFWGTNNGYLAGIMAEGPRQSCIEAALMACAGINNIGDYIYFCSHRSAKYETYKQWVDIDGNVFYKK